MKTKTISLLIILISMICSCKKSEDINIDSIGDKKWALSKIIDKETGEIERFPEHLDKIIIIFTSDGNIESLGFCNGLGGNYKLNNPNSLRIRLNPSTSKSCLPALRMDWERKYENNFPYSETYTITDNELSVKCNSQYDLVFDIVE